MRTLNYRQRQFVCLYLGRCNGNATEAAKKAGYLNPEQAAQKLMQHPIVRAAIDAKLEEASMQADEVLARISDQAAVDPDDFMEEYEHQVGIDPDTGDPLFETRMRFSYKKAKARGKTHLIKKWKVLPDGTVEAELHDSSSALDRLAKVHGLYKEKIDLNVAIGDSPEDRSRFTKLLAGFAYLEGSSLDREDRGQIESSPSGDDCHEWGMGAGETPALPEPEVAGSGDG